MTTLRKRALLAHRAPLAALACLSASLALATTDPENPGSSRRSTEISHASRPAAQAAGRVAALPAPAHDRELAAAPGQVGPRLPVPVLPQSSPIALVGATVHTISGADIEGATVLIDKGKIQAVGRDIAIPAGTRKESLAGLHIYPSLIEANSTLGLIEIGAVRATRDVNEVGEINPNARAIVSVNPDSELLPVTRSNGILVALTAPRGGLISGTAAVIALDGWTWESMALVRDAALMINWPDMRIDRSSASKVPAEKQERDRDERVRKIRDAFDTARAYARGQDAVAAGGVIPERDVKWDAMIRAARREIPVIVRAGSILEIEAALKLTDELDLRMILLGGRDAAKVAPELKRRNIPVLVGDVLPVGRSFEPYDSNFTIPRDLQAAGVAFAIVSTSDGGDAGHARNLPYVAAKAVAFGLAHDEGLKAVTLYPARILGLGDRLGSIEPGKDATLIVTDGDPLEGTTNVLRAYLAGTELDLTDRHKQLYERYRLKPRRASR